MVKQTRRELLQMKTEHFDKLNLEVFFDSAGQRLVVEGRATLWSAHIQIGIQVQAIMSTAGAHRQELFGCIDEELIFAGPGVWSELSENA